MCTGTIFSYFFRVGCVVTIIATMTYFSGDTSRAYPETGGAGYDQ